MKLWSDRRRLGKVGNVVVRVRHLLSLHFSVSLLLPSSSSLSHILTLLTCIVFISS